MDLGISGRTALVCAASKGLGRACALSLAREGASVTICARTPETLAQAAADIETETGNPVTAVACDITTEEGRQAVLAARAAPDILVNNAAGPPAGDFRDWDSENWMSAVNNNMLTPILLIKSVIDGMIERRFGRIVNITSYAVKQPIPTLGLSNGARAGLTGFVAGLARQVAANNVTINNLLPGPFETDRLLDNIRFAAKQAGRPFEQELERRRDGNPAGRFGDPAEFGDACAFLCAAQSGYLVGQNLILDGGEIRTTL
ncbi:MAG: SDR family oxidoreductase [Alphaproteobacteria bacterium]|nr:SDR family oxidoreductase [Alphaproteobacteria bacterium]